MYIPAHCPGVMGASNCVSGKGYRHERSVVRRKSAVSVVWNLGSDRGYPTLLGKVAAEQARLVLQSMEAAARTFVQAGDALDMLGPGKW